MGKRSFRLSSRGGVLGRLRGLLQVSSRGAPHAQSYWDGGGDSCFASSHHTLPAKSWVEVTWECLSLALSRPLDLGRRPGEWREGLDLGGDTLLLLFFGDGGKFCLSTATPTGWPSVR